MPDVVLLFPGQGSQYVGMGKSFYDDYASVRRLVEEASALTGKDLRMLCFEGPDTALRETGNVQPAITLVNVACLSVLQEEGLCERPVAAAGHSLGEYAALVAAGTLTFADAIRVVDARGAAMSEAAGRHPGGMAAVFGLDRHSLDAICAEVRDVGSVEVANHNSPLQIVLTGAQLALQEATKMAKSRGAKLIVPLKVSGPWHSRFMADAAMPVRAALERCTLSPPRMPVLANVDAEPYPGDPASIRSRLVDQIVSPVLWADSMRRLVEDGRRLFLEVGPGKVLAGLMRDVGQPVTTVSVQDGASLSKARSALAGTA